MIAITPFYAALLALLFVFLSFRVLSFRRMEGIALGDGTNAQLLRRMRVHANFAEYCPYAIVLIALAELQGSPAWAIHALAASLVVGRTIHAFGVSKEPENFNFRVAGMGLTLTVIAVAALINCVLSLGKLL